MGYLFVRLDAQRSCDGFEIFGELPMTDVDADARDERGWMLLNHGAGQFLFVEDHIVRPAQIGLHARNSVYRLLDGQSQRHGQDGQGVRRQRQAQNDRDIETFTRRGVPSVAVTADAVCLVLGNDNRSMRLAALGELCRVNHGRGGGLKPDLHNSSSRKLMSFAGAECVMAPAETKSAPASA